jgi:hypothetical protein
MRHPTKDFLTTKWVMTLRLQGMKKEVHPSTPTPIFDGILAISSFRHAGMDCRHPGPQDASEHIHAKPGSRQSMPGRRVL